MSKVNNSIVFPGLVKKKKKAVIADDKLNIAKTSNDLGNWYNTHGKYDNALKEYKCEANAYSVLGLRLENARAHRMIGEMYMLSSQFSEALKHEEIHLGLSILLADRILYYISARFCNFFTGLYNINCSVLL